VDETTPRLLLLPRARLWPAQGLLPDDDEDKDKGDAVPSTTTRDADVDVIDVDDDYDMPAVAAAAAGTEIKTETLNIPARPRAPPERVTAKPRSGKAAARGKCQKYPIDYSLPSSTTTTTTPPLLLLTTTKTTLQPLPLLRACLQAPLPSSPAATLICTSDLWEGLCSEAVPALMPVYARGVDCRGEEYTLFLAAIARATDCRRPRVLFEDVFVVVVSRLVGLFAEAFNLLLPCSYAAFTVLPVPGVDQDIMKRQFWTKMAVKIVLKEERYAKTRLAALDYIENFLATPLGQSVTSLLRLGEPIWDAMRSTIVLTFGLSSIVTRMDSCERAAKVGGSLVNSVYESANAGGWTYVLNVIYFQEKTNLRRVGVVFRTPGFTLVPPLP